MRLLAFTSRNTKEILRDAITLCFGLGFPLVMLLLFYAINKNIPAEAHMTMFEMPSIAPGISVFGLSFMALFTGQLIAKDKTTSFTLRLFTSPLTSSEFILGYTLPLIPMAIVQSAICYIVAIILGLKISVNLLLAIVVNIPIAIVFIALGLLLGTVLNEKAVGGICGALLTNLCAWFSNIWFDISLVGGLFEKIANYLPFVHAVNAAKFAIRGNYGEIMPQLVWVMVYAVVLLAVAIAVFSLKTKENK